MLLQMLTAPEGWGQEVWVSLWGLTVRLHKHSLLLSLLSWPHFYPTFSLHSPVPCLTSILVLISQKFLILISILPANNDSTSDSSCLSVTSQAFQHSHFQSSFPPFLVLPWDDPSMESSFKRSCVSVQKPQSYRAGPVLRIPVLRDGRPFTKYLQIDLLGMLFPRPYHAAHHRAGRCQIPIPEHTNTWGFCKHRQGYVLPQSYPQTYKLHWLITSKSSTWNGHRKGKLSSGFGHWLN